jgi:hypothetical protein
MTTTTYTDDLVERNRQAPAQPRQLAALERILAQREVPAEFVDAFAAVSRGDIVATSAMVARTIQLAQQYPYRRLDHQPSLVDALAEARADELAPTAA